MTTAKGPSQPTRHLLDEFEEIRRTFREVEVNAAGALRAKLALNEACSVPELMRGLDELMRSRARRSGLPEDVSEGELTIAVPRLLAAMSESECQALKLDVEHATGLVVLLHYLRICLVGFEDLSTAAGSVLVRLRRALQAWEDERSAGRMRWWQQDRAQRILRGLHRRMNVMSGAVTSIAFYFKEGYRLAERHPRAAHLITSVEEKGLQSAQAVKLLEDEAGEACRLYSHPWWRFWG